MSVSLPHYLEQIPQSYIYHIKKNDDFYKMSFDINDNHLINYQKLRTMSIDIQIAQNVQLLGYKIADIKEDNFHEMGKTFRIFTIELMDSIENYNDLLKQEKTIAKNLNLYDKNIILELV